MDTSVDSDKDVAIESDMYDERLPGDGDWFRYAFIALLLVMAAEGYGIFRAFLWLIHQFHG